jgi:Rad52/22 family double-strand break repair protein
VAGEQHHKIRKTSRTGNSLCGPQSIYGSAQFLVHPAGWTRKYTVHTSANFERKPDQKSVAKVFVTCELMIFGLGSHSATGEEWTDNDNAGTSAEAQAFKRSCACFGLGRYLYDFQGSGLTWMSGNDQRLPSSCSVGPRLKDGARVSVRIESTLSRRTPVQSPRIRTRRKSNRCHKLISVG